MTYRSKTIETFTCDYCGKEIASEDNFIKLAVHRPDSYDKRFMRQEGEFLCDICDKCLVKIFVKAFNGSATDSVLKDYKYKYIDENGELRNDQQ